ncbi:hypothetical protein Q5P01_011676 [Channa striata]|uniref:BHLH domain-containing protein n=1 Tax=Channa striata TaxID=64152 RepID=A0AA88MXX9_CHASR|nr:hypothetical protein Q5P01_011676 [Channa striata]
MKVFQGEKDEKAKSKSPKPLVERRRRQRMNRSLDALKSLLLQRQEESQRRVEKAEILERAVLFLQDSAERDKTSAAGLRRRLSFQDGVSACLQRAAHFLGPDWKDLGLGAALEASFAARPATSDCESAGVCSSSGSLRLGKSSRAVLRMLIHRSGYRWCPTGPNVASCVQTREGSSRSPTTSHQLHKVASRANDQSPAQSHPVIQCVWRPWF